ncbi:sugar ABC transporter substrate-binding protein [uncultured Thiothrix sp.]|uniref:sugar ABC transporter substrate-binding protein n=1 Tax=uncultured Thiothrix sp. TaxID=223185 RepID=UPI0026297665|nr:sugar ABC transporter substrate-binding protein [uncultured Thiothrix sp.]
MSNLIQGLSRLALSLTLAFSASSVLAANIAVVGGKTDDAFWNKIKKGIDDARLIVEANGGKVNYLQLQSYDNLGPDAAQLVRTAMSQKVQGIVVPNWVPEAEDEAIKAAVAAGIKVIMINAGTIEKANELGAINYVGSDEYLAGKAGGEYFAAKGQKNVLCVNTVPGAANLEARCKGVIEGITGKGGKGKQLPLPATSFGDPTAVAEAIKATLVGDKTIDGLITISAGDADSAAIGIGQANASETVKLGTFDFNEANLDRIKNGKQLFAIDQQPYLQSLLGVLMLNAYIDFGNKLPTAPVLTGPGIVDASNIDATLAGVKKGAR